MIEMQGHGPSVDCTQRPTTLTVAWLKGPSIVGVVVKSAFRVHAPPPCEDEVAVVGGLLQVCDYAKDAE